MAIYDMHRSSADPVSTRIATATVDLAIRLVDAWNARATERALRRLSDHELYDIGLTRGDIATLSGRN